ncbi:MAG: hypothetical protein JWP85_2088 [Rhodoglobus sp.]|nr:hypothetical protein [Rhodoglobus sp.]
MIAHIQTIFGDGSDGSTPGNCLQTAVASLLDLPVEAVPHFVAEEDWWGAVIAWVRASGLRLTMFEERFNVEASYAGGYLATAPLAAAPDDVLMLAGGMAARGFRHVVLWQHGHLVHDPHPSGTGLTGEPDSLWRIEVAA